MIALIVARVAIAWAGLKSLRPIRAAIETWSAVRPAWPIFAAILCGGYVLGFHPQGRQGLLGVFQQPDLVLFVTCGLLLSFGVLVHGWTIELARRPHQNRPHAYRGQRAVSAVAAIAAIALPVWISLVLVCVTTLDAQGPVSACEFALIISGLPLITFCLVFRWWLVPLVPVCVWLVLVAWQAIEVPESSGRLASVSSAVIVAASLRILMWRWYRRHESSFSQLVTLDKWYVRLLRGFLAAFVALGLASSFSLIQEAIGPVSVLLLGLGAWGVGLSWFFIRPKPAFALAAIAVVGLWPWSSASLHDVRTVESIEPLRRNVVYDWLAARIGPIEDKRQIPVVVVLAEGGGIYAALNSAGVLAELDRRTNGALFENTFVFSGVSGGSVGIATYLAGRADGVFRRNGSLEKITAFLSNDYLSPLTSGFFFRDMPAGLLSLSLLSMIGIHIPDRAAFLEEKFEEKWRDTVGGKAFAESFADVVRRGTGPDAREPVVLFGTARQSDGRLAVIGNISFDRPDSRKPSAIRNLAEDVSLPLSTAAGVSARFPFVSPPARIPLKQGASAFAAAPEYARYVDGGYIDGTGSLAARRALEMLWAAAADIETLTGREIRGRLKVVVLHFFERTLHNDTVEGDASLEVFAPFQAIEAARAARGAFAVEALCRSVAGEGDGTACDTLGDNRTFAAGLGRLFVKSCGSPETNAERDEVVSSAMEQLPWINAALDIGQPGSKCFVPLGWYVGAAREYVRDEIFRRSGKICAALAHQFPNASKDWRCA